MKNVSQHYRRTHQIESCNTHRMQGYNCLGKLSISLVEEPSSPQEMEWLLMKMHHRYRNSWVAGILRYICS